jgi:hypothetical protein
MKRLVLINSILINLSLKYQKALVRKTSIGLPSFGNVIAIRKNIG